MTGTRVVDLGRLVERWDVAKRHALLADIDVGGSTVAVAALHLSFVVPNAAAQLRRLAGHLPTDRPSVVAGDCNLWACSPTRSVPRHRRAVRGRTWPAHRLHSQLDHILVSPDVTIRRAEVLTPSGSDHLPVIAELEVP
ncbi:MAG: endonuclease/exonuclease/phosphatase family protein [Acidimicrobiales bacterium]